MGTPSRPIKFDNQNGSDVGASGCGPPIQATGTGDLSSAFGVNRIFNCTNLTGVQVGDLVYVPSVTPKFNLITGISGSTLTVEQAWSSSTSGVNIYIGGSRSTIDHSDSRQLFGGDCTGDGWDIEIADTGTDYTIPSPIELAYEKEIKGTGGVPNIVAASSFVNDSLFKGALSQGSTRFYFTSLGFDSTTARNFDEITPLNSDSALFEDGRALELVFRNCEFGFVNTNNCDVFFAPDFARLHASGCRFRSGLITYYNKSDLDAHFQSCFFQGRNDTENTYGLFGGSASTPLFTVCGCVFADFRKSGGTSAYGIYPQGNKFYAHSNIFYNCYQGVRVTQFSIAVNNLFHTCTNGVDFSTSASTESPSTQANGFYNCTNNYNIARDSYNTITDIEFSADPLADPANDDYSLSSSGSTEVSSFFPYGSAGTTAGSPPAPYSPLRSFDSSSGGGGGIKKVTMNGGMDG